MDAGTLDRQAGKQTDARHTHIDWQNDEFYGREMHRSIDIKINT